MARTALGKALHALRHKAIEAGMKLFSADEVLEEVKDRRIGFTDEERRRLMTKRKEEFVLLAIEAMPNDQQAYTVVARGFSSTRDVLAYLKKDGKEGTYQIAAFKGAPVVCKLRQEVRRDLTPITE